MEYKLPPLPEPTGSVEIDCGQAPGGGREVMFVDGFNAAQMQAYAIAAIEAQGVPDEYDALWNALQRIDNAACSLPWFKVANEGGIDAVAQNIIDAMLASAPPAPQAEIVEATQPHPTNNYLFKLLCEKAGIVLGVDRVDTACEKVARMSPCVDSKCPNYWDDAYDDLKPGDIETDCEPAPQEVVGHQSPDPMGDSDKKEQPHKAAGSGFAQSFTTSQESVGGLRELYGDAYGETPTAPQASTAQPEPSLYVSEYELAQFNRASDWMTATIRKHPGDGRVALYTHPAQQAKPQPLSDEQIREAVNGAGMMFTAPDIKVARAIEAAHGIQGS